MNEINNLFDPLSSGNKGMRYAIEGINIHGEEKYNSLRSLGKTPSEIVLLTEDEVFFLLENK